MNLLNIIDLPLLVLDDHRVLRALYDGSQVPHERLEVLVNLQEHVSLSALLQLPLGFPFLHLCL